MYFEAPWYDSPLKNIGFLSGGATSQVGRTQSFELSFTWAGTGFQNDNIMIAANTVLNPENNADCFISDVFAFGLRKTDEIPALLVSVHSRKTGINDCLKLKV